MDDLEAFARLGIAVAIGVLVGLERGWERRDEPEGRRVAGVRTFALLALAGAAAGLLAERLEVLIAGFGFVAVAIVLLGARLRAARETKDVGATTIVAGLVT